MVATIALIELVGYVVLLLWGMHMVQSGVVRAFGSTLRAGIGRTLHNRFAAVGAGLAVTVLLQSSTATAMMTASLAAGGLVELVPALAVMLGANVGTALIVKLLSFDISWIVPLLLIAGYVAFRKVRRGIPHDLGRVGIGLGLMLLALHQLVSTIEPVETAPALKVLLDALTGEPLLDLALAAILTWAAHSSIAVMLLVVSLAAGGVVTLPAAIALVLGANLGGTIPPVLETAQTDPAGRRLPIGNMAIRAVGCVATLPLIHPIAALLSRFDPDAAGSAVDFHILFNLAIKLVFVWFLDPVARALRQVLPTIQKPADVTDPLYLEESATFMTGDTRSASRLLERKRQLNAMERATSRRHLARLKVHQPEELEASTVYLTMLRDLRRVNSHICGIGYDVLGLMDPSDQGDSPVQEMPGEAIPRPCQPPR